MIKKANCLTRTQRRHLKSPIRGIYVEGDYDLLDLYLTRYNTAVITLQTALSLHHLIDEWPNAPFDLCFKNGYRPIKDRLIRQYRDPSKIQQLGIELIKRNKINYYIYNKERLLIELWRRKKCIGNDIYKQAIHRYRYLAENGKLNIPLIKKYIASVPKSELFYCKLSDEVL